MTNEKKLEFDFKDTCELYLEEAGIKEEWQRLRISGKLWVLIARNLDEKKFSKQEILDLLPEEKIGYGYENGWNEYRQAVIDKLEKA
jgi:hypothetical protein